MPRLYPLLLKPEFHERVWGSRDLRPIYPQVVSHEPIGEAWVAADECRVANGPYAGQTLGELCKREGEGLVGSACDRHDRFPLMVKFLFPRDRLSVQVHPDDAAAQALGIPCGKTECWYVARAIAGAQVGLGLRPGVTREQFEDAITQNRAESLLNWLDIRSGEMIYVDAGTVHAIGPNSILIETQQNCDITYRLYDYGRPRQLHVREGLAVIRETTAAGRVTRQARDGHDVLVAAPSFVVEEFNLHQGQTLSEQPRDSAQVLVASEGVGVVEWEGSPVTLQCGEAVVIPASLASYTLRPQWALKLLRMAVPAEQLPQPAAVLA
ncbi:MAG TPA: type I phosphomannose isomerase catalytic subunit [candidate division Zixibacteria bacterium]|nr:type I phosphomannose isomerase catalytic subunit [candidate division Zixibacteria bacterium]